MYVDFRFCTVNPALLLDNKALLVYSLLRIIEFVSVLGNAFLSLLDLFEKNIKIFFVLSKNNLLK